MGDAAMTRRERVARAIYDAPNGIDGDQLADMLLDHHMGHNEEAIMLICLNAADAAIAVYEAALAEEGMVIVPREATRRSPRGRRRGASRSALA